jgi:hypothetical protein
MVLAIHYVTVSSLNVPLTPSGVLFVNGICVSAYVSIQQDLTNVLVHHWSKKVPGGATLLQHDYIHILASKSCPYYMHGRYLQ